MSSNQNCFRILKGFCAPASGISCVLLCLLASTMLLVGCTNLSEKRVISAFQTGLEEHNLEALREQSTAQFEQRALRHPEAGDALEQLHIPDGKYEIVSVEDVSETEKKVTVGFGDDQRRKIQYQLVKDPESKRWVVDDILLRQRAGGKTVTMPVTEQMDVLLTSREFFEAWTGTDRQKALAYCDPEFSESLGKLPPRLLAGLITRVVGSGERSKSFRPEVYISGDDAYVKINRAHGKLLATLEKSGDRWHVKDVGLETSEKEQEIKSLHKTADLCYETVVFLDAWQSKDKSTIETVMEKTLYQASIAPANLADVDLPDSIAMDTHMDVKLMENRADVVVQDEEKTARITFQALDDEHSDYQITDVTIYDLQQEQTLSLAAALTARPVAELFVEALVHRDHKMLQYSSTRELHERTWSRVARKTLEIAPFGNFQFQGAKVDEMQFLGDVTHVRMSAPKGKFTVILHEQHGKALVDDLLINPDESTPLAVTSLRDYLGAVLPAYELASCIHHNQPQATLRLVTDDFYDRVFSVSKGMPENAYTILDYLSTGTPVVTTSNNSEEVQQMLRPSHGESVIERDASDLRKSYLTIKTPKGKMVVALHEEEGLLRVDDALVTLPHESIATRLKQAMRMDIASRSTSGIQLASGEVRVPAQEAPMKNKAPLPPAGEVMTAHFEVQADPGAESMIDQTAHQQMAPVTPAGCPECEANPGLNEPGKLEPAPEYLLLQPIATE